MERSCPLGTTRCIPQAKLPQKPYNKSFTDQVCSAKMTGCWPCSFFASLWNSTSSRSINTQKKELGQYQVILTQQTWSIIHTYYIYYIILYYIMLYCILLYLTCLTIIRQRRSEYWWIFPETNSRGIFSNIHEPERNNCFSIITQVIIEIPKRFKALAKRTGK